MHRAIIPVSISLVSLHSPPLSSIYAQANIAVLDRLAALEREVAAHKATLVEMKAALEQTKATLDTTTANLEKAQGSLEDVAAAFWWLPHDQQVSYIHCVPCSLSVAQLHKSS